MTGHSVVPTGHRRARPGARALLALGLATGCSRKPAPPVTPIPVTVAVVRPAAVPYTLTANGQVEPLETARVAAQVSGLVTEVTFREGDPVRQGQVLFRIDPRPYAAALAEARGALARDRAQAANASRGVDRLRALVRQDYVTQSEVDSQTTTARADVATVAADRAAVARAQFDLANTVIRAPIGGRTGSVLVRRGNLVAADPSQPLVVINRLDPILVRFAVPEAALAQVQLAHRAGPVAVRVRPADWSAPSGGLGGAGTADSGATQDPPEGSAATADASDSRGTLTFIDNAVDTTTGTVQLKARLRNPDGGLWPGQFVLVTLELGVQPGALVIPTRAAQVGQQGAYVFVVQPNGRAVSRAVALGRSAGIAAVVVERGLAPGERVVTDGQSRLTAGASVRVTGEDSTVPIAGAAL